jgi:hypothetical protein
MKAKFLALLTLVIAISVTNADAQARVRARHQHQRIKQGVRSGEITKAEAVNLRNGQKEIRQDVRAAKADGVVTPGEKKEIRQDQRQQSRKIFRKKHNGRDRN